MRFLNGSVLCLLFLSAIFISCNKEVSVTPEEVPASSGIMVINSNPPGAEIFINDDNSGKLTPDSIIHLPPGQYKIKMRLYPYLDIIDSLIVNEDEPQYFTADFFGDTRNFGNITVNSIPEGAQVFLRDSSLNMVTPALIDHLWPGLYSIACTYPEHRKKYTYVLVRGGEEKTTTITLQDTSTFVDYYQVNSDFPVVQTLCVAIDNENYKWVGLPGTGLVKFKTSETVTYDHKNSDLPHDFVSCIEIDDQNRIWIGTHGGLVVIDNGNWTVYTIENSDIPHDHITAITFDNLGNTWIGATDPNVARLLIKFDGNNWTAYEAPNIITALAADFNNSIWVGLNLGFRVFENETWVNYLSAQDQAPKLIDHPVETIAVDIDGKVWLGAGGVGRGFAYIAGGLFLYDGNTFTRINISEELISHIHVAPNGNKWISSLGQYPLNDVEETRTVLIKIEPDGNIVSYTQGNSDIPAVMLRASCSQSNGELWIASRDRGLLKFKGANL